MPISNNSLNGAEYIAETTIYKIDFILQYIIFWARL